MFFFNKTKNELNELRNDIKNLKEKNEYLENKLKEDNKYLKNVLKLNKFYSDIILKFSNKRFYLDALQEIESFCEDNNKNFSLTDGLRNHIKGKVGELAVLKELIGKKSYKSMEYFYDINIGDINKSKQFDFLVISPNTIHIIEVKNWDLKSLELVNNTDNTSKVLKALYKSGTKVLIDFNEIKTRCESINNILKSFNEKFKEKFKNEKNFTIYNIIVFTNAIPSIEGEIKREKILEKENLEDTNYYYPINGIKMNTESDMRLQVLTKRAIGNYFDRFIPSEKNSTKNQLTRLYELTKFIKNDINFINSTDQIYILESIKEFFNSVYKKIENEKIENNKNIDLIFDKSYDNKKSN